MFLQSRHTNCIRYGKLGRTPEPRSKTDGPLTFYLLGDPATNLRQEKEVEIAYDRREKMKLFLFVSGHLQSLELYSYKFTIPKITEQWSVAVRFTRNSSRRSKLYNYTTLCIVDVCKAFRPGRGRGLLIAVIPALRKLGLKDQEFRHWQHEILTQNSNKRAFYYKHKETLSAIVVKLQYKHGS